MSLPQGLVQDASGWKGIESSLNCPSTLLSRGAASGPSADLIEALFGSRLIFAIF